MAAAVVPIHAVEPAPLGVQHQALDVGQVAVDLAALDVAEPATISLAMSVRYSPTHS